jgi:hypothetical protein
LAPTPSARAVLDETFTIAAPGCCLRYGTAARPAPARKHAAQHREDRAVGGSELGPLDLAAQHGELVAKHGDLDILGGSLREFPSSMPRSRRIIAWLGPRCSAHPAEFLNLGGALIDLGGLIGGGPRWRLAGIAGVLLTGRHNGCWS